MVERDGRTKSPVHIHVIDEAPVHVHLKKSKKISRPKSAVNVSISMKFLSNYLLSFYSEYDRLHGEIKSIILSKIFKIFTTII